MKEKNRAEYERFDKMTWDQVLLSTELQYQLFVLYWSEKGHEACCLDTVLKPFFFDIKNELFNSVQLEKKRIMSKFKIAKNGVLYVGSLNTYFTNDNLTDEAALEYLRENPNSRKNFEVLPDDVDEMLKETVVSDEQFTKDKAVVDANNKAFEESQQDKKTAAKTSKKKEGKKSEESSSDKA